MFTITMEKTWSDTSVTLFGQSSRPREKMLLSEVVGSTSSEGYSS